jgi:hypothetical protein
MSIIINNNKTPNGENKGSFNRGVFVGIVMSFIVMILSRQAFYLHESHYLTDIVDPELEKVTHFKDVSYLIESIQLLNYIILKLIFYFQFFIS